MTESVVFFSKHDMLNVLAGHLVNVCLIRIGHLGLHIYCTTISVSFLFVLFCAFKMIIICLMKKNGIQLI